MAMAYVDGELDQAGRREMEQLLPGRPDLAREVVQHQRLNIVARQMAGPEPIDTEWARLDREVLHSGGLKLGLTLLLAGFLGLFGWCGWSLFSSSMELVPKLLAGALLSGAALTFLLVLRARIRTLPYDPYRAIKR
jgi:hypothetical protein